MTQQFAHRLTFVILLLCQLSICLATEIPDPNESSKYLDAVRTFADNVLKYGRDTYGPKHTPLFVDGLNIHTHEPVKWIDPDGTKWILSNLASQQNLFRTLDGLSTITGDPKYRQAAVEAIEYAFENLRSPNGLLYWGIEVAYDAQKDSIHNPESRHVLKSQHPYYELMWEVDAEATRQFIEAFWAAHIINWSNLDMNRIGRPFNAPLEKPWIQKYTGGPVFFQSRGRSMLTTGSDLFCAAGLLTKLSGDREPLNWAKRLAYRYIETRDPHVGISGHRYTRNEIDAAQYQFGEDFKGRPVRKGMLVPPVPGLGNPDVRESILGYLIITPGIEYSITTGPWASSMLLGGILDNNGRDFIKWGLEELTALGKVVYRQQDNVFIPMFTNGISLEGYVCKKDSVIGWRGLKFKAIPVVAMDFWVYALSYRITGDQFMWHMARNIASGHDLGDIGITPEKHHQLKTTTDCWQPFTLLGFLELYRKTGNQAFLQIAQTIGDNLLVHRFHKGFFVPSDKHIYTKFDAIEPLILLNLHAALKASSVSVPIVWPNRSIFNVAYRHRRLAMDNSLIYTLTDSLEPPKSLLEAATEGDLDRVKAMVARGANVNVRDQFGASALHYASQQGHKEVAELLIVKGARVDAGRITSLHYAAESGHKDMIELLIVKGADVNAKNAAGQTPLHYAAENGRKDIVEMLIANEADVNAKNNNGQTPVDIALDQNYKDIVELLLEKGTELSIYVTAYLGDIDKVKSFIETGTSVNGDPGRGHRTPLYWAVRNDHKDVAKLLIEKGADVSSVSLLYYVCMHGHRDLAEFLIQKGADANSKNWGDTPSHYAVWGGHVDVLELLLAYGADANAKGSAAGSLLYYAAGSGSTDMTRLLLNKSADVNIKENEGGQTPLHRAAGKGHTTVAELLITNGADVNAKDNQGRTPLHYAQENGHTKIAELLRKSTANLESSSEPRHDVAITGVSALSRVPKDYTVPVVVNIENQGDFSESFEVTLIDVTDGKEIGSKSVTLSAAGREGMDETFDSTLTGPTKPGPNEPYTQYGNYLWFGDVNGDGYDDLLVAGASRWNQCQGRAYLYYGGQNMDEKADNTFTGEAIDNYFGEGAALVDVNGDGFDDVILGAWKYNNAQGRVYIYHGSPDMDENADLILDGREGTNDRFGNKICAGDVNNDGYDDLFVNALGWNKRTGRVYLYYGGDPMDTTADLIFNGENEGDIFGCTIDDPKMIGDVNGDGYGDLLITTRFWKAGSGQGRAYLYYGGEGTSMDSIPDKVLTGENGHDEFAVSSCIFDIDNDGFDDVIIGARRWNRNQGRVYVFWGAEDMDLNADLIIDGEPGARAALGGATIDAGYVNNDRYGDILVAAYNYYRGSHTGRAYLFYGDTKASINTGCDKTFTLPKDTRNSPQHVALGDLNNDSYPEVAIGGWRYNKGQGRVWIYYNNPPSSTEVKLDWDTTRANIGKHTLKAIVSPIRGEKDIADHTMTVTVEVKEPSK